MSWRPGGWAEIKRQHCEARNSIDYLSGFETGANAMLRALKQEAVMTPDLIPMSDGCAVKIPLEKPSWVIVIPDEARGESPSAEQQKKARS